MIRSLFVLFFVILAVFAGCAPQSLEIEDDSENHTYIQDQDIILEQMKKSNESAGYKGEVFDIKTTHGIELEEKNKLFKDTLSNQTYEGNSSEEN